MLSATLPSLVRIPHRLQFLLVWLWMLTIGALFSQAEPPKIIRQPDHQGILAGSPSVTFDVAAEGASPLSFQWRFYTSTNPPAYTLLSNETNASLTLTSPSYQPANRRWFSVVVTNLEGAVTSQLARLVVVTQALQRIEIQTSSLSVNEGDGEIVLGLNRSIVRFGSDVPLSYLNSSVMTLDFQTQDDTAISNLDYVSMSGTVSFGPGETNKTLHIPILRDGVPEPSESFQILFNNLHGFAVELRSRGSSISLPITIVDNDSPLAVSGPTNIGEDAGFATIEVRRNDDGTNTVTVDYATGVGTATPGVDFTPVQGTLTFAPGETAKSFTIPILNDGLVEGNETIPIEFSRATGGAAFDLEGHTESEWILTVNDNDPGVEWGAAEFSVAEEGGKFSVTVLRGDDGADPVRVHFRTLDDTAVAGQDYIAASGVLEFGPGEQSKALDFELMNDGFREGNETFFLILESPTGTVLGPNAKAAVTIVDNDVGLQWTEPRYSVSETGVVATVVVRRGSDGGTPVRVRYHTQAGTAIGGLDFDEVQGEITLPAGEETHVIEIPIRNDDVVEKTESFSVVLTDLVGEASWGDVTNTTVRILDDEPVPVSYGFSVPVIATGQTHALAIQSDGSLWAWGFNGAGQLGVGLGMGSPINVPTQVGQDTNWVMVASGNSHSLAIQSDGSLWSWGDNGSGQLGYGNGMGGVFDLPTQVGTDNDWRWIAAGAFHSVGLKKDGSLWAWGNNALFQLGNGSAESKDAPIRIGLENDWEFIAAGWNQTFALKSDGTLWSWGDNNSGQLGLGDSPVPFDGTPTAVGEDSDWDFIVTAGGDGGWSSVSDALAIRHNGSLWSWGNGGGGVLGDPTSPTRNVPGKVGSVTSWKILAAGRSHSLGVQQNGTLWSWGRNIFGALGTDSEDGAIQPEPTQVGEAADWEFISAGDAFSVGLRGDGTLWSWGGNQNGQLGLGDEWLNVNVKVPTQIRSVGEWLIPNRIPLHRTNDFRIVSQKVQADGSLSVFFTHTNSHAYYVLYRGNRVDGISQPVAMAFPKRPFVLVDRDPLPRHGAFYYRIEAIDRDHPRDFDGDSLDDVYELTYGAFLNPLNPADAAEDFDGDGVSNLVEHQSGRDPSQYDLTTSRQSLASSFRHQLAIRADGSLWAWGENSRGQLGIGPRGGQETPVQVGTDLDWVSVAVGCRITDGGHSVALKRNGTLWTWGANEFGQLGDGTTSDLDVPQQVGTDQDWIQVAAGGTFTMALKKDGSLWVWGGDGTQILGAASPDALHLGPQRIGTDSDWKVLAAGLDYALALKQDRSLWAWGGNAGLQTGLGDLNCCGGSINYPTRVGVETNWIAVSADGGAGSQSYGLKNDRTLWGWGGALGLGLGSHPFPTQIGTDSDWDSISPGSAFAFARKRNGTLWGAGPGFGNAFGRVFADVKWKETSVGGLYGYRDYGLVSQSGLGITEDGQLWSWSFLGNSSVPVQFGTDHHWSTVGARFDRSQALTADGVLWQWGYNFQDELQPQPVQTDFRWKSASLGNRFTVALREDGTVWTWGFNVGGQLGNGSLDLSFSSTPQAVLPELVFQSVAAGNDHVLALTQEGALWSWGVNSAGQLGVPAAQISPFTAIPQSFLKLTPWNAISAGFELSAAIRSDGSLWMWGANPNGQLGNGKLNGTTPNGPQTVIGNAQWSFVSCGDAHTLAIRTDGSVWSWGNNNNGQLGNGLVLPQSPGLSRPQGVKTDKKWKKVAAGGAHSVGIATDGSLWAWGSNIEGQLGDGTFKDSSIPILIAPGATWTEIAAGGRHTLAIRSDGTLWVWGRNLESQLGLVSSELGGKVLDDSHAWGVPK